VLPRRGGGNAHWKLKIFSAVQRQRYFDIKLCTSMRRPRDSVVYARTIETFRLNDAALNRHYHSSFFMMLIFKYEHIA